MYSHGIVQFQNAGNVRFHLFGRRGSKCRADRTHRQLFHKHRDVQIALPKVLSPLRYTMRLIYSHHADLHPLRHAKKALRHQSLRGSIQNPALPLLHRLHGVIELFLTDAAVDIRRRNPHLPQRLHLILHQRDQRRDHNRQPRQQQCGDLVTH